MASLELRASVFDKLNSLLDNDEAMEQLDNYLLRLKKKMTKKVTEVPLNPYTMEELNARIDEAEAEEDAGLPGIPHKQVMEKMRKMIATL